MLACDSSAHSENHKHTRTFDVRETTLTTPDLTTSTPITLTLHNTQPSKHM